MTKRKAKDLFPLSMFTPVRLRWLTAVFPLILLVALTHLFAQTSQPAPFAWHAQPLHAQVITATATITPTETVVPATETATATATAVPPTATLRPVRVDDIEPNELSTLTGGTITLYGVGFSPDTIVRLVDYGVLHATYINANTLTAVVPPGVPPRKYDIQAGRGNISGSSAVLKDALRITAPEETPEPTDTPVPTATTPYVFGQPQLLLQTASTNPATLQPGQPFELTLELVNLGNYVAIDITADLQSGDIAIPAAGSNVRIIQRLGVEETTTLTLPLLLSETAVSGPQTLTFKLDYFDLNGRSYTSQQNVGLTVGDTTPTPTPTPQSNQPRIVLTTYLVEPDANLRPGALFDLSLTVTNVGDGTASNILQTLGGENGAQLQPFALLNASNVRFIEELAPGQSIQLTQQMIVAGTAESGVYNLPIAFSYPLGDGSTQTDSQVLNLLVQKQPQLTVNFYRSVLPGLVGEPVDLPVEVVNIGRSLVNVSTITLSSPDLTFDNSSAYVGPLDGGTSGSLDGVGIPQRGGDLELTVTVNYLDDFNQPQAFSDTLTISVAEPVTEDETAVSSPSDTPPEDEGFLGKLWRFVRGMLGLGS